MSYASSEGFPVSYRHSREIALGAAQALATRHGLLIDSRALRERGPEGETLAIDCCVLGARNPRQALVVSSALHGVEGFAGAAIQHRMLNSMLGAIRLARDTAIIVIHAINPYGFAWLRRVNEHNVDLNRNFVARFDARVSDAYLELFDALNPPDLDPANESARWRIIDQWIAAHGLGSFQKALSEGQYRFAQAMQFGGFEPSQSREHVLGFVDDCLGDTERLVWIDFHTGLGASGQCELLSAAESGSAALTFTRQVFGDAVVVPGSAPSVSPPVLGALEQAIARRLPSAQRAFVTPEFGTHPLERVVRALRADNWLHAHGHADDLGDPMTRAIKAELIEAFRPESALWRARILSTGEALIRRALAALPGIGSH